VDVARFAQHGGGVPRNSRSAAANAINVMVTFASQRNL
jgi:hypothetical protein